MMWMHMIAIQMLSGLIALPVVGETLDASGLLRIFFMMGRAALSGHCAKLMRPSVIAATI